MGKPSNNQTTQGATISEAFHPRVEPSELERSTPPTRASAKLEPGSTLAASLTSRPASPSFESHHEPTPPALIGDSDTHYRVLSSFVYNVPTLSTPKPQRANGLKQALAQVLADVVTTEDEDDDGDVFYDALEFQAPSTPSVSSTFPTPKSQRAIGVQQAPYDSEPEGASKGRTTVSTRGARASRLTTTYGSSHTFPPVAVARGSSSSVAAPPTLGPSIFAQPPTPPTTPEPRVPAKKALLIGVNYTTDTQNRLRHAVRDANAFGQVLAEALDFPEDNLFFVTDEERQAPSHQSSTSGHVLHQVAAATAAAPFSVSAGQRWQGHVHHEGKKRFVQATKLNFIQGCKWLVKDAKASDELVMLFSGHCAIIGGQPYLVMPNASNIRDMVSKDDLRSVLVSKIPKGCRLTIVLDCCHSASLVDLPYCVGNMRPKAASSEGLEAQEGTVLTEALACPTNKPASESEHSLQTSLYGVGPGLIMREPESVLVTEDSAPDVGNTTESFAPPAAVSRVAKRQGGVVAASAPAPAQSANASTSSTWISAWLSGSTTSKEPVPAIIEARSPGATSAEVRRTRSCVVETTRLAEYFEKRKPGSDPPAGDITVLAAAGADQSAFEASGRIKHGIVTNAVCEALRSCKTISYRNLWAYVQSAIESENVRRRERDQTKLESERQAPEKRVQHAELWASRPEGMTCAAPFLDGRAFCPVVAADPHPKPHAAVVGVNLGTRPRSLTPSVV